MQHSNANYQQFVTDMSPPSWITTKTRFRVRSFLANLANFSAWNFIKVQTPLKLFFCEFWEIFQPATLLKTRHRHKCFPVNFSKSFLRNSYFVEHLPKASSNHIICVIFFCKIYSIVRCGCLKRHFFHLNRLNRHHFDFVKHL